MIGGLAGYAIYYFLLMDLAARFFSTITSAYYVISICLLIFSIAGCILVLNLIFEKKIDRHLFILISVCYFLILFFALFDRYALGGIFIWNPLTSLRKIFSQEIGSSELLLESVLNLLMFVPMGYYFRNLDTKKMAVIAMVISTAIELIQGITRRGFFDTFDIILYFTGMYIGYLICKRLPPLFQVTKEKKE